MIIKTGTTLTADQARAIITAYGAEHVCFDGELPVELDIAYIQDNDTFTGSCRDKGKIHSLRF
ncbi:hypothetical protein DBO86_20385 [Pseudomonas indoloxydans]|uniref:Uncharacterized protein n=1 Tax=Ectopseudomonas oleovorans TaxID=301 RepID=A0A2T5PI13_ECTOL|nr:hypothetical protein [Pseudomonas indoloxydans]PTU77341.1 hypothetical protein DBO86_20385 [Pseudomonas indoloxydans]